MGIVNCVPYVVFLLLMACSGTSAASGMRLLSRALPAYASSGVAARANDADYDSFWRSSGTPATLAFDLSSISRADRQKILLVWYNDPTFGYDHALINDVGYNNPGSYTVEVNSGDGGERPPRSGWIVVATVSNNTLQVSRRIAG
jgi:hypothetical protein